VASLPAVDPSADELHLGQPIRADVRGGPVRGGFLRAVSVALGTPGGTGAALGTISWSWLGHGGCGVYSQPA
jgi:hypothetical protein